MPRRTALSLDLLQTFLVMVDLEGDAPRATKQLEINQPSMSKRLAYLQHAGKVLKHPWLVRDGKTWQVTDEGRRVLPAVREIVSRFEQLHRFIGQPAARQILFACGQQAVTGFVRQAIHRFRRDFPHVRLRVATLRGRERIERVANGFLDLATVTHEEPVVQEIAHRQLHVEPLREDRLALVCGEDTPWSARVRRLPKDRVGPEGFVGLPLILPEPDAGLRRGLDKVFRERGLLEKLEVLFEIGGWHAILSFTRAGDGVGVVSEAAIGRSDGLIVRFLDHKVFPLIATRLICRNVQGPGQKLDLSPEGAAFRELLKQAAEA